MAVIRLGENSADDINGCCEDTQIRSGTNGNTNYDGDGWLRVKDETTSANYDRKTLIRFDLAGLGAGTIINASLFLWSLDDDDGLALALYTCLREWVEATATWNNYDGANPWGALHDQGVLLHTWTSPATIGVYHEITSAALIAYLQDVLDGADGVPVGEANFLIKAQAGEADGPIIWWQDSEAADGQRPYLQIELEPPENGNGNGNGNGGGTVRPSIIRSGVGLGPNI